MAYVIINEKHLTAIADVLRARDGRDTYKPREMAPAIERLDLLNSAGILGRYFKGGEVPGETFEVIVGECCINEDGTYFIPEGLYHNKTIKGEVEIPFGVIELSDGVFKDTVGITNVVFPYGFITINKEAFRNALDMTSIKLGPDVQVVGEYAFADNEKLLIIELNDSLTTLNNYAFAQIPNLKQVVGTIPNVPNYAFAGCASLSDITLSDDIKTIGGYAFSGCSSLTGDFICPPNVTSIGSYAFSGCGLDSITLNDNLTSIGSYAFSRSELKEIKNFPANMTTIGSRAFSNCYNLNHITLPDSVVSINSYAFANDDVWEEDRPGSGISSITFGENVQTIGQYAFGNGNLTEVTLPPKLTSLQKAVFLNNWNLSKITMNEGLTEMRSFCLGGTNLKEISLPSSLKDFAPDAFHTPNVASGGSNLKKIEFNLSPNHQLVFQNGWAWGEVGIAMDIRPTSANKNYIIFKGQNCPIPKVYGFGWNYDSDIFEHEGVNNVNTVISVPWSQSENPQGFPWGATSATIIYNNGL